MREMMVIDGGQLRRLMKVCRALNNGEGVAIQQLKARIKASRRTVFRDFELLRRMGLSVRLLRGQYWIASNMAACRKAILSYQVQEVRRHVSEFLK